MAIPKCRTPGNRYCRFDGCRVYGGEFYMDSHELLVHGVCSCGWLGAVRNHGHHIGQMVRHSEDPIDEPRGHSIITYLR